MNEPSERVDLTDESAALRDEVPVELMNPLIASALIARQLA